MSISYRVISIGTLSRNRCWNETAPKRSAYSTTTLIRSENTTILVDPGLPEKLLALQLDERAGITPEEIDIVFLTTYRPIHRRGLSLFAQATWMVHEPEIGIMRQNLDDIEARHPDTVDSGDVRKLVRQERVFLDKMSPAPEKLTRSVHLFPTAGITPGAAGLLLALPSRTVVVAGDAVISQDYCEAGRIFEQVIDLDQARESFSEILEIADEIIPGHDNLFSVPGR